MTWEAVTHELKCAPPFFADVLHGKKTFEIRFNDRNYKFGDILWLREYDASGVDKSIGRSPYTGRECHATVTYILDDSNYVKPGFVVMGIKLRVV